MPNQNATQDWRERGGGSGESVFHSGSSGGGKRGGRRLPSVVQPKPKPKSVTFGENRISVFLRDPTTIAQASQQARL